MTLSGIPLLATGYTPTPGDVVQIVQVGQTLGVLARQSRPTGIVSF